jgi:hypothetical protein
MAQAWFALADQVEKNGGLVVGLSSQPDKS